jgi:hypothetical protein
MPRILLVPDRFADYRMWSGIPDRIRGRAEVVHFDRHDQVPWTAADDGFLSTARRLADDGAFDIVAAAGQAARFGFAVAEAGLARGAVFFYPSLDRVLDETVSGLDEADLMETLGPYVPIVGAMQEEDPSRRRDILLRVVRETAGPEAGPAELAHMEGMIIDHAEEFFAYLRTAMDAVAAGPAHPAPPGLDRPWIDRLADLTIPVTAVVAPRSLAIGDAIASRAADAEIVVASPGMAPVAEPGRSAAILVRMLDRLG